MEMPGIQRLFAEAKAGKRQALEKLLEAHRPLVSAIAQRYTDRWEDQQDLAQEVMKAAYRSFGNVRDGMAFTKWMMSIAENHGKNWLTRERPKQKVTDSLDGEAYQEGGSAQQIEPHPCPEDQIVAAETTRYIYRVLEQICSGEEYNVLVRRWNEEEYSKIAAELSIKEATARSYCHRGERKLWASLLADHREFLGGEMVIAEAISKAAKAHHLAERLTDEEKRAFQVGDKSKQAFVSACMKIRPFLPLSVCFVFFWSVSYG